MAIFRCPKITTAQRSELVLSEAEIVFDTDLKLYFGGDNDRVGGFPLGDGSQPIKELIEINQNQIDNKSITLTSLPLNPTASKFTFINGTVQLYGIDYVIDGQNIDWQGLGLDGFIEVGDLVLIEYN